MDKLTYQYERQGSGALASNKLRYVHDPVSDAAYADDIDSQTGLTLGQVHDDNKHCKAATILPTMPSAFD